MPVSHAIKVDEEFEKSPGWESLNAAVDSTSGLLSLAAKSNQADSELTSAIARLSHCDESAARLQIAGNLQKLARGNTKAMWGLFSQIAAEEPSKIVLTRLVSTLSRFGGPKALALVDQIYRKTRGEPGVSNLQTACSSFFLKLCLTQTNALAMEHLAEVFDRPWGFSEQVGNLLHALRDCLTLGSVQEGTDEETRLRRMALALVKRTLVAATTELDRLAGIYAGKSGDEIPAEARDQFNSLHGVIEGISNQIYFASGAFDGKTKNAAKMLDDPRRERFLRETSDILDLLAKTGIVDIAFHLAEMLASLIDFDPAGVFLRLRDVVRIAKKGGFQYESLAADVVVKAVEQFLAAHALVLRDRTDCREALVEILDTFVAAGWPSAHQLTYRLADVFR